MQGISYWIDKRAMITPNRMALIGEHETLTYFEMSQKVHHVAGTLQLKYNVQRGDRIGILSKNNVDFIITLFAVARLNAIMVPLNIRLTTEELEFQVNDSGLETLVVEQDLFEQGKELMNRSNLMNLIEFKDLRGNEKVELNQMDVNASAPFIICYTSGTTGKPKGAVLTQENMFWNAVNNLVAINISSHDRTITLLPLFHIGGIGLFTLPVLMAGGTVIVPNKFDPQQALELIEKYKVTIVMGVPTIHDGIRKAENFETTNLESVRWFYSGGAPCPEELIRFYLERGVQFGQGYGLTETSPTVFMLSEEDYQNKIGSIGKPALFTDIRIVDDDGQDVPPGKVGELLVKGGNVMKEYWNRPEATEKSMVEGWFATGDLVSRDDDGFVYIAGRKKEMIISGGENIYPLEIEKVIYEIADIDEVAVIGIPHEKWGEVPIAIVSLKSDARTSIEEIKEYCAKRLARYKVPYTVKIVSALPKNATGKIDKAALKIFHSEQEVK